MPPCLSHSWLKCGDSSHLDGTVVPSAEPLGLPAWIPTPTRGHRGGWHAPSLVWMLAWLGPTWWVLGGVFKKKEQHLLRSIEDLFKIYLRSIPVVPYTPSLFASDCLQPSVVRDCLIFLVCFSRERHRVAPAPLLPRTTPRWTFLYRLPQASISMSLALYPGVKFLGHTVWKRLTCLNIQVCSSPHLPAVRTSFCVHTSPLPPALCFPLSSFSSLLGVKECFFFPLISDY